MVFYYDSIGEYGLVAALEDLGDNNPWGVVIYKFKADKPLLVVVIRTL